MHLTENPCLLKCHHIFVIFIVCIYLVVYYDVDLWCMGWFCVPDLCLSFVTVCVCVQYDHLNVIISRTEPDQTQRLQDAL